MIFMIPQMLKCRATLAGSATGIALVVLIAAPAIAVSQTVNPPDHDYWVYVANESSDLVSRVRFGPAGAVEEKTIEIGYHPTDLDGAHGLTISSAGTHWYVSIAHGRPYGQVWQMATGTDRLVDSMTVGLFPATMALTPDGATLYVVNFNLHGDPVPSSVSAVFTPFMRELKKIETCVKPHGSLVSADGRKHYSACVASDQLVEISTDEMTVTRRMRLTVGSEGPVTDRERAERASGANACKPTWVAASPGDANLYVPCNGRSEVLELDPITLAIKRRLPTGAGPYNAAVTADGRTLVVTLKESPSRGAHRSGERRGD